MTDEKKNLSSMINKGLLTVYGPLISFVVACGFIANWIATNILKSDIVDFIVMIAVLISILIGWTWWSYKIVKWKYWAFSKLDLNDSYELYSKAIAVGLIWPTGSIFNKTEIWTKADRNRWSNINPEIKSIFEVKD
jgi:hypothetical protein